MYTVPAAIKPKIIEDRFANNAEPVNRFQREDFEGRFSGTDPNVLTNTQGNTFERNLLASIAEAAQSPIPEVAARAKFILTAASNPAVLNGAVLPGPKRTQPANLIDRAGAVYDSRIPQSPNPRLSTPPTKEENVNTKRKGQDNPFTRRLAKGTVAPRRNALRPSEYYNTPSMGVAKGSAYIREEEPNQWVPGPAANPFLAGLTGSTVNPMNRTIPVAPIQVSPGGVGARMPVITMPSQRMPLPTQRVLPGSYPAPPPNPFLMGGANRVSGNPFRR